MPKMNAMFPSKYLAAADLDEREQTYTVSGIDTEVVGQGDEAESKWVLYFSEADKGLVLNKTNATSISGALGDDTDDWIGRQIVLYPTEVAFSGKMVACIRVKEKATRTLAQQAMKRAQAQRMPVPDSKPAGKPAKPMTQEEADDIDEMDGPPF